MKHSLAKQALFCVLICGLLTGCGESGKETKESEDTTTQAQTEAPRDNLPSDLDFGGKTVNITVGDYNDAWWDDIYVEEITGNRLDDAIYNASVSVEQRINVDLEYNRVRYGWNDMSEYETKMVSQILAGDTDFDLLFSGSTNFSAMSTDGHYFGDLSSLKYVTLESPWYNQSAIECMPDDYIDFLMGGFAIGNIKNVFCMYFNQSLLDDMQIKENMYEIVDSGEWTLDKLSEMIKGGYSDLNGNT